MKANQFIKNQEADVLGLPMYLIIVMIIAVAVIAAVIYMIPTGTKTMTAQISPGVIAATTIAGGTAHNDTAKIWVNVSTMDAQRNPISGATVTLTGLGTVINFDEKGVGSYLGVAPTNQNITLPNNVNEGYLRLIIRAPGGFENYEDSQAIFVVRQN
jgi:hypothetical protein